MFMAKRDCCGLGLSGEVTTSISSLFRASTSRAHHCLGKILMNITKSDTEVLLSTLTSLRLVKVTSNKCYHDILATEWQIFIPDSLEAGDVVQLGDIVVDVAVVGRTTGSTRSSGALSGSWDQFCLLRALIVDCNSDTSITWTSEVTSEAKLKQNSFVSVLFQTWLHVQ